MKSVRSNYMNGVIYDKTKNYGKNKCIRKAEIKIRKTHNTHKTKIEMYLALIQSINTLN